MRFGKMCRKCGAKTFALISREAKATTASDSRANIDENHGSV